MRTTTRTALLTAAATLAAYPVLRPYGPETGADGAADLASAAWLAAHVLAMVGFVALALGLRSAAVPEPGLRGTETRAWLAAALLLPYYGAEAYGLNAVARHAVETGDNGVLAVADSFRYAPFEVTSFALGWFLLAWVGVSLARRAWAQGGAARVGGLLAGVGLASYLPQFFGTPEVRVAHGLVVGAGLLLLAVTGRSGGPGAHPDAVLGGAQPLERAV